jgi:uncharacterized OB-fold protein
MTSDTPNGFRVAGEGYFDWPQALNKVSVLHGAKCKQCAEVIFPSLLDCPVCVTPATMGPYDLRGSGTLVDFVIAQRGPEGFSVPYVQAYVKLDDGPTIYSMLTDVEISESGPKVGMRMVLVLMSIREEDGAVLIGWKFRPDETYCA